MLSIDPRVREGMGLQLEQWRHTVDGGADRVGWKMGRAIEEVEAFMGSQPVVGHLTSATMLRPGDAFDASGVGVLRAETELTLELGHRVEAGDAPERLHGGIARMRVALELVDLGPPRGDVVPVLAANVFHRAFAMGPHGRRLSTAGRRATLEVNGQPRGEGTLSDEYASTIHDAATLLAEFGERLEPGDCIIVGSVVHVPVTGGDRVTAAIDGLGAVDVTITT